MSFAPIVKGFPLHFAELENAKSINEKLIPAYQRIRDQEKIRQTHHFHGRFENTYIDLKDIPELQPIVDAATHYASEITGIENLKSGFWFNEMHPGHRTSLHSHEELDEVLSCVYYVTSPENSGHLVLRDDYQDSFVEPHAGMFAFFPPWLEHEVEENKSSEMRLSVAFNFGDAG